MIINGIIGIVVGYLLGSIPSAYIAARRAKGKDIRQLGSGNVGGLNTYRQPGLPGLRLRIRAISSLTAGEDRRDRLFISLLYLQ